MTRAVPNIFGALTTPSLPNLDNDFTAMTPTLVLPCTVVGTNALTLTPVTGTLSQTAYTDKELFSFQAVATSTSAMTVQVAALAALNLYKAGGTIQAGSGDVVLGQLYLVAYQASLNSAAGGFVILSAVAGAGATILRDYLAGLALSNDGSTPNSVLDIAAGQATDSTNVVYIGLNSAITKSTAGSWSVGSGQNGMGTGLSISSSTWYHVFAIINSGVADAYFDTSVTAANAPSGTTAFRRIGSILTDGSAHILGFIQRYDLFFWKTIPALDVAGGALASATPTNYTLNSVPTGVNVEAIVHVNSNVNGNPGNIYLYSPDIGDQTPSATATPLASFLSVAAGAANQGVGGQLRVVTNTAAYIRAEVSISSTLYIVAIGWRDFLGRSS